MKQVSYSLVQNEIDFRYALHHRTESTQQFQDIALGRIKRVQLPLGKKVPDKYAKGDSATITNGAGRWYVSNTGWGSEGKRGTWPCDFNALNLRLNNVMKLMYRDVVRKCRILHVSLVRIDHVNYQESGITGFETNSYKNGVDNNRYRMPEYAYEAMWHKLHGFEDESRCLFVWDIEFEVID